MAVCVRSPHKHDLHASLTSVIMTNSQLLKVSEIHGLHGELVDHSLLKLVFV